MVSGSGLRSTKIIMHASSSRVLGLTLIIFALLACKCSASIFDKFHVRVINEISPHTILHLHCKSGDDDLGEHQLRYKEALPWSFHTNVWGSTLYWCDMWWKKLDGKVVRGTYDIFYTPRDWPICAHHCPFHVRPDGIYEWFGWPDTKKDKLVYRWPKS